MAEIKGDLWPIGGPIRIYLNGKWLPGTVEAKQQDRILSRLADGRQVWRQAKHCGGRWQGPLIERAK